MILTLALRYNANITNYNICYHYNFDITNYKSIRDFTVQRQIASWYQFRLLQYNTQTVANCEQIDFKQTQILRRKTINLIRNLLAWFASGLGEGVGGNEWETAITGSWVSVSAGWLLSWDLNDWKTGKRWRGARSILLQSVPNCTTLTCREHSTDVNFREILHKDGGEACETEDQNGDNESQVDVLLEIHDCESKLCKNTVFDW